MRQHRFLIHSLIAVIIFAFATFNATAQTQLSADLIEKIATAEQSLVESLRRITRQELEQGVRYAVMPLFACVVGASLRD